MIKKIRKRMQSDDYRFFHENNNLGKNIILIGLGGSYAYGMNKDSSDLDIRGISLNKKEEVLLGIDFEQVVDEKTDTTIYSFNKMIQLLTKMNPNTCEILGLQDWQYFYLHPIGKELLENRKMFLSKICIHTFGGYASSQLRRMENKAARLVGQAQNEEYILKSIKNAAYNFRYRYVPFGEDDSLMLFTAPSNRDDMESEIFMSINLRMFETLSFERLDWYVE